MWQLLLFPPYRWGNGHHQGDLPFIVIYTVSSTQVNPLTPESNLGRICYWLVLQMKVPGRHKDSNWLARVTPSWNRQNPGSKPSGLCWEAPKQGPGLFLSLLPLAGGLMLECATVSACVTHTHTLTLAHSHTIAAPPGFLLFLLSLCGFPILVWHPKKKKKKNLRQRHNKGN